MLLKRIAAAASLVILAGCGDKSTGPITLDGLVQFMYQGSGVNGLSGTFTGDGAMPVASVDQQMLPSGWAQSHTGQGAVFATSMQPRGVSSHDMSILTIRRTTVGTETLTAGCSTNCSRLYVMFGSSNTGTSGGVPFLQECTMTVGTITIASISSTRVSGTFSGTGTCTNTFGAAAGTFTVMNGTFDTAIVNTG